MEIPNEVYLVCVVLKASKKQLKEDEDAADMIVVQPTAILAKSEQLAMVKALRLVPEDHAKKDDRLEVRVIPFRRAC